MQLLVFGYGPGRDGLYPSPGQKNGGGRRRSTLPPNDSPTGVEDDRIRKMTRKPIRGTASNATLVR